MRAFEDYYRPDVPIASDVDELADPGLDQNRDRGQVNDLVMNLVLKYIAGSLDISPSDPREIKAVAESSIGNTPEDVMRILMTSFAPELAGAGLGTLDKLGIQSLSDLRATAAIFKEIAFNDRFEDTQDFVGVDLGAGTGILTLAGIVAARRKRIARAVVIGMDNVQKNLQMANRVLSSALRRTDEFQMVPIDITNPRVWVELFGGLPLSSWISETIAFTTPKIDVTDNDARIVVSGTRNRVAAAAGLVQTQQFDPFPQAFINTVRYRTGFLGDVRQGRTAMFPNIVNGDYRPDHDNSTIRLRTSNDSAQVRLDHVGDEFADYEALGDDKRWQWEDPEAMVRELDAKLRPALEPLARMASGLSREFGVDRDDFMAPGTQGLVQELAEGMDPMELMRMLGIPVSKGGGSRKSGPTTAEKKKQRKQQKASRKRNR